jgi:phosphoglycerate dehydrogenase-like enzyme
MMEKIILDANPRTLDTIFSPPDLKRLEAMAEIVWGKDDPMPEERYSKAKHDAKIVVTGRWRYGSLEGWDRLAAIMEVSGAHPSPKVLDYETCFERGIRVLSCAPAFAPMVAELALGVALASLRGIVEADRAMRTGNERWGHSEVSTLYGQPVGFIGYGNLARALRPLLSPFKCTIAAHDPWLPDSYLLREGLKPVGLETVLESSKVIFVLAIPSAENRELLSRDRLEKIQPDALLVLISRSHLVDFDALTELVGQGRFKATVDVFPKEPPPRDHPIRSVSGAVLTPHLAGAPGRRNIGRLVVDDVETILSGLPPMSMQVAQPELVKRRR